MRLGKIEFDDATTEELRELHTVMGIALVAHDAN
jgi:hypothetical protein